MSAASSSRHDVALTAPVVSILERPVYGVAQAAGLLGLRRDRTRAWLDGYEHPGVRYAPVIRESHTGDDAWDTRQATQRARTIHNR